VLIAFTRCSSIFFLPSSSLNHTNKRGGKMQTNNLYAYSTFANFLCLIYSFIIRVNISNVESNNWRIHTRRVSLHVWFRIKTTWKQTFIFRHYTMTTLSESRRSDSRPSSRVSAPGERKLQYHYPPLSKEKSILLHSSFNIDCQMLLSRTCNYFKATQLFIQHWTRWSKMWIRLQSWFDENVKNR
jgi:hypothetical protein